MKSDFPRVTQAVGSKVSLEPGLLNLHPKLLAFLFVGLVLYLCVWCAHVC